MSYISLCTLLLDNSGETWHDIYLWYEINSNRCYRGKTRYNTIFLFGKNCMFTVMLSLAPKIFGEWEYQARTSLSVGSYKNRNRVFFHHNGSWNISYSVQSIIYWKLTYPSYWEEAIIIKKKTVCLEFSLLNIIPFLSFLKTYLEMGKKREVKMTKHYPFWIALN